MNPGLRFSIGLATLIASAPIIVGCFFIWESVASYQARASYESKKQASEGEVIAIEMRQVARYRRPSTKMPTIVYRFTTASGLIQTGRNQGRVPVGSRFPVVYDPSNPEYSDIKSYFEEKLPGYRSACYTMIPVGLLCISIGAFFLYCIHR